MVPKVSLIQGFAHPIKIKHKKCAFQVFNFVLGGQVPGSKKSFGGVSDPRSPLNFFNAICLIFWVWPYLNPEKSSQPYNHLNV